MYRQETSKMRLRTKPNLETCSTCSAFTLDDVLALLSVEEEEEEEEELARAEIRDALLADSAAARCS